LEIGSGIFFLFCFIDYFSYKIKRWWPISWYWWSI